MNTANVPERVDVVVVGGGMAGLSAARDLLAANVSVLVLELQISTPPQGHSTAKVRRSSLRRAD